MEHIIQDETEREAALEAMKEFIKRRMETPCSEWVEVNEDDTLFTKAKARVQARRD